MANQGKITKEIAYKLEENGWRVIYTCVPNTPHINVIPIPTLNGSSKQKYPDIVAYRGGITKFIEVEISLTESVANDILERFNEYTSTLKIFATWVSWKEHILSQTQHKLPEEFIVSKELIICNPIKGKQILYSDVLKKNDIKVSFFLDY